MRIIKEGKIIFDTSLKCFRGRGDDDILHSLEDIRIRDLFPSEIPDENIIADFDDAYQKNLEVWNAKIIIAAG